MAHTTNGPAHQARRAAPRRRSRPSARLRSPLDGTLPQQRSAPEDQGGARPVLRWVLVTDDDGHTHPEARWDT